MPRKKIPSQLDLKVAMIADEETVAGFILAGVGQRDGTGLENNNFYFPP
jgi:hypothetical protein